MLFFLLLITNYQYIDPFFRLNFFFISRYFLVYIYNLFFSYASGMFAGGQIKGLHMRFGAT